MSGTPVRDRTDWFQRIVAKAMAPRKLTRFETAAQLHRQLDQLV